MKTIEIARRPSKCPKCGGEICKILYGMPSPTAQEEYYAKHHRHLILGGCCIFEDMPDFECYDCGQAFRIR